MNAREATEPRMISPDVAPRWPELCGEQNAACLCMKHKGHDGFHACPHGIWIAARPEGEA